MYKCTTLECERHKDCVVQIAESRPGAHGPGPGEHQHQVLVQLAQGPKN